MTPALPMEWITMTESQRTAFLERVRPGVGPEDYRLIEGISHALPEILALIEQDPMSIGKLRHLVFGPKTEKTHRVCPNAAPPAPGSQAPKPKPKGHGRTKARDYTGARWVHIAHPQLKPGDSCPQCSKGAVRLQPSPAIALRIVGAPPISATGYAMEPLRCDTCGEVFTAPTPPQAGQEKYDASVGATVALLRYGSGMPHYRLARLQKSLGVPMPESTQWETMKPLTLFLRQAGAPLDNNVCERALKMAILHRKNSLSYKTLNGARTGDLFMSLIHTCRLNGVNPFDYLLTIAQHPDAVKLLPKTWLPWNYPRSPTGSLRA